ncbi:MAG: hypothetical protein AAF639_45785, partial [Chloroflexota bacterium]
NGVHAMSVRGTTARVTLAMKITQQDIRPVRGGAVGKAGHAARWPSTLLSGSVIGESVVTDTEY